ncbi:ATP-binding cassette domain-containing protein [Vibrio sp. L5-1]|uniref:ATP-binding cassette domain-containing protein n=1 Tax=Vibrio qingdaonensis TaxID=2829491 RepID=A0A9X3CLA3_9VIBR|nr:MULTISPECIES: ATP-binding cassette domain-containing protein [Vibrio]MCF7497060.1 ATP-binding cassette domain-containing protein [Vibrio sp. L5-1]MCW8345498.1 ATP-binding cassette domain-containing protein [Vibrio qingdaonensis]
MPLIKIRNLTKSFHKNSNNTVVLDKIDLDIHEGELVAIVGSSGSGKSTLMNIISGLDSNWSGDYHLDSCDMQSYDNEQWAKIRSCYFGFIFQSYNLIPYLSCLENIKLPLLYFKCKKPHYSNTLVETINRLDIKEVSSNKPSELSGGQQQRVSIARALVSEPRILLADEPTGALDIRNSEEVINILKEINKDGTTVIIVTHDMSIAELCDRQVSISDGKVINGINEGSVVNDKINHNEIQGYNFPYRMKTVLLNLFFLYKNNKIKLFLSLIGVIVGIATIVLSLSVSESVEKQVISELSRMGNNTVQAASYGEQDGLLIEDTFNKLKTFNEIKYISPYLRAQKKIKRAFKKYDNSISNDASTILGVSHEFKNLIKLRLLIGRLMNQEEVELGQTVVVINEILNKQLFGTHDSIGNKLIIDNMVFTIIGIVKQSDARTPQPIAWIPYTTFIHRISNSNVINEFHFTAIESDLEKIIIDYLYKITKGSYTFWSDKEYVESLNRVKNLFSIFILSISFISLFVGGSGIMNIMLASVSERYSEIGLRRAIGASKKNILEQFLIESLFVTLLGGFLGVLLSVGTLIVMKNILIDFEIILSSYSIFVGVTFSLFTGLLFGLLPAIKASKLNPIEALSR